MELTSELSVSITDNSVAFEYQVSNRSEEATTLEFRSGKRFDITVTSIDSTDIIWQASEGKAFTMALESVQLQAGESTVFTAEVNDLAPGTYEATATLETTDHELPATIQFTIE